MLTLRLFLRAIDTILPLSWQLLLGYARNKRDIDVTMSCYCVTTKQTLDRRTIPVTVFQHLLVVEQA